MEAMNTYFIFCTNDIGDKHLFFLSKRAAEFKWMLIRSSIGEVNGAITSIIVVCWAQKEINIQILRDGNHSS
jgi:hypothetical protein